MTDFPNPLYTSTSKILTLLYTRGLKKVPLPVGAPRIDHYREYPRVTERNLSQRTVMLGRHFRQPATTISTWPLETSKMTTKIRKTRKQTVKSVGKYATKLMKKYLEFKSTVVKIDRTHDTRHLWIRTRIDGIKAMSRCILGGQTSDTSNRGRVILFYWKDTTIS